MADNHEITFLRYYAKINIVGEISFYSQSDLHTRGPVRTPTTLGRISLRDYRKNPDLNLLNGPEPDWQKKDHSDTLGEYALRALTSKEEKELFDALGGK